MDIRNTYVVRRSVPQNIKLSYNSNTYNIIDSDSVVYVSVLDDEYLCDFTVGKKTYQVLFKYDNITINCYNIHIMYVILQYIFRVNNIIELSKLNWNYSKWKVDIIPLNGKSLSSNLLVIKHLLNLKTYGNILEIKDLESECPLTDNRGWGGERPREVNYKYGFPLMTSAHMKTLKPKQRLIKCPFPIENINPKRKAIVQDFEGIKKCFTCGVKDGEKDKFGNVCNFEKGHLEPHIIGGDSTASYQCKWCNTFYKDKITWDFETRKPKFNLFAILRDAPKKEVMGILSQLGYTV
jgi:hypothetical protein